MPRVVPYCTVPYRTVPYRTVSDETEKRQLEATINNVTTNDRRRVSMIFIRFYIQPPRSLFALVSSRRAAAAASFFPVFWEGTVAVVVFTIYSL